MARFGSFGSGLAGGYLEQSALNQKRDEAQATAKYRQGTLDASALTQRIDLTKGALKENGEAIQAAQAFLLQNPDHPSAKSVIDGLVQQRKILFNQYEQMGAPGGGDVQAQVPAGVAEDTYAVGRSIMGKTSGREIGQAPLDTEAAWELKEGADKNWYRLNPQTKEWDLIKEIEETVAPSAANAVLRVDQPEGVTETWIHSSLLPKDHGQEVNPLGYVRAGAGGPQQNIAPGWLLHPNPGPDQPQIVAYDKATMSDADFQKRLDEGYKPVGIPGWDSKDVSGVEAAGLTDADTSKALDAISKSAVAATELAGLFRKWTKAGETVAGLSGRLRSGVGGAIGGVLGNWAEEKWTDVLNEMSDTDVSVEEMAELEAGFKAQVSETVEVFTGEESGRITQEERKVAAEALAASVVGKSFKQAQQAMLHILVMHESEMMRINALLDRPYRYDLSKPDQLNAYGQKLYKDLGGSGDRETRKNREITASVEGMIDRLERIQDAVNATVRGQGSQRDVAWAKYKATN